MPAEVVVPECEAAMAKAAAVEDMSRAIPAAAAMKYRATASEAAAVKRRTAPMKAATAAMVTAAAAAATTMTTTAVTAADFGSESLGNLFRRSCGTWIDQRQRYRALAACNGQQQYRGGRKTEATDKAAPGICHFHHL